MGWLRGGDGEGINQGRGEEGSRGKPGREEKSLNAPSQIFEYQIPKYGPEGNGRLMMISCLDLPGFINWVGGVNCPKRNETRRNETMSG